MYILAKKILCNSLELRDVAISDLLLQALPPPEGQKVLENIPSIHFRREKKFSCMR